MKQRAELRCITKEFGGRSVIKDGVFPRPDLYAANSASHTTTRKHFQTLTSGKAQAPFYLMTFHAITSRVYHLVGSGGCTTPIVSVTTRGTLVYVAVSFAWGKNIH